MKIPSTFFERLAVYWLDLLALAVLAIALNFLLRSCNIYQSWGGDYAGYLGQARAIAEGRGGDSNYIYNPALPYLAPPAYPMGYPMLLALVYKWVGLDTLAFARFNTMTWWLTGVMLFFFLRREFFTLPALVTSIFFLFAPEFFASKNLVLPDFLFATWVLAAVYWYNYRDRGRYVNALWCGLLAGLAWITRANGALLLLAFGLDTLLHYLSNVWKYRNWKPDVGQWRFLAILLGAALAVQGLVHGIFFPLPESGGYFNQLQTEYFAKQNITLNINTIVIQLLNYYQLEPTMFIYRIKNDDVLVRLGGALAIGLAFLGLFRPLSAAGRFNLLLLVLFLGLLAFWPHVQHLRYLLPVVCLLMYFLLRGLTNVDLHSPWSNGLKWAAVPLMLVGAYWHIDHEVHDALRSANDGAPEHWVNRESFKFISENTPPAARIATYHPLITGLYAERKCVRWRYTWDSKEIWEEFMRFEVDYLLYNSQLGASDSSLHQLIRERPGAIREVWRNSRNILYEINPDD